MVFRAAGIACQYAPFLQMQESGRTQAIVSTCYPPLSHSSSTGCSFGAFETAPQDRSEERFFKSLETRKSVRN